MDLKDLKLRIKSFQTAKIIKILFLLTLHPNTFYGMLRYQFSTYYRIFAFLSIYGLAGSLDELKNQINTANSYRNELENYLITHDVDTEGLQLSMIDTFHLERLVKAHVTECMTSFTPSVGHC